MNTSTKVVIALGAAGFLTLVGIGLYEHHAHAAGGKPSPRPNPNPPSPQNPPAPQQNPAGKVHVNGYFPQRVTQLLPGGTYLVSISPLPGNTLSNAVSAVNATPGMLIAESWDVGQIPDGWPSDDVEPNRWRYVLVLAPNLVVAPQVLATFIVHQAKT